MLIVNTHSHDLLLYLLSFYSRCFVSCFDVRWADWPCLTAAVTLSMPLYYSNWKHHNQPRPFLRSHCDQHNGELGGGTWLKNKIWISDYCSVLTLTHCIHKGCSRQELRVTWDRNFPRSVNLMFVTFEAEISVKRNIFILDPWQNS